jgi:hypothetical protein
MSVSHLRRAVSVTSALQLCDGRDSLDEAVEIVTDPVGFAVETARLSVVIGGTISKIQCIVLVVSVGLREVNFRQQCVRVW